MQFKRGSTRSQMSQRVLLSVSAVALSLFFGSGAKCQIIRQQFNAASKYTGFGTSVACVGDIDQDGFDDILIGEPQYDSPAHTNCGRFTLYSGYTSIVLLQVTGTNNYERLGAVVEGIYDPVTPPYFGQPIVFAVSAPGRVTDVSGTNHYGAVDQYNSSLTRDWDAVGPTSPSAFGASIEYISPAFYDLDGDAYGDWAVGDPLSNGTGEVFLIGSNSSVHGNVIGTISGTQVGEAFGSQIAFQFDTDGDLQTELFISAPDYSAPTQFFVGQIRAFNLVPGPPWTGAQMSGTITGPVQFIHYGSVMAGGGDIDGDYRCDLLIGVPTFNGNTGAVLVCCGASAFGTINSTLTATTPAAGEYFGASVAFIGSSTTTGSDVAIGTPRAVLPGSGGSPTMAHGRVEVVDATVALTTGAITAKFLAYGSSTGASLGDIVAGGGDVDGSLYQDLLAGSSDPKNNAMNPYITAYEVPSCSPSKRYVGDPAPLTPPYAIVNIVETVPMQGSNITIRMLSHKTSGSMPAWLIYGTNYLAQPQTLGGTIYVAPTFAMVPVTLPAAPTTLNIAYPLPAGTIYCGTHIFLQLVVPDSSLSIGAAFSPAFELTIG